VRQVEREHIDQINRYLADELGRVGVLVTRNPLKRAELQRTVDLWSGQRKAIIMLTDEDIAQMVEVFESKQRAPMDVVAKKYVEFRRACP
jgi:glutamate racemase